jgi:HEAT repeat protein
LVESLGGPDRCRYEAIEAMGKRRDPFFIPALTRALDGELPIEAAAALGAIGQPAALQVLVEKLATGCGPAVGAAAKTLEAVTGQGFGRDHQAWSRWMAAPSSMVH